MTKATGVRVLYLYCKNKKQLLCIQGTEGETGQMSKREHLTRPGSNNFYLVSWHVCFKITGESAGWGLPHQDRTVGASQTCPPQKGKLFHFVNMLALLTLCCLVNPTRLEPKLLNYLQPLFDPDLL